MREENKKFSSKKLLLTILRTVIVSVFIGTTLLFIEVLPNWLQYEIISNSEPNSQTVIEIGKNLEGEMESIKEKFAEDKEKYGEEYPTEEIFFNNTANYFSSSSVVTVYSMSFLIGIVLGSIVYIVSIQNAKGKNLILELVLTFIVVVAIMLVLNIGYSWIINKTINQINLTQIDYSTYIYDLQINNMLISYIIAIVVIYIGNMVYQKVITNKLNKELNKK